MAPAASSPSTITRRATVTRRIHELLRRAGLEDIVTPVIAQSSYTWELMKLIERRSNGRCRPMFDSCFIDGAHSWDVDGFAFFLVEKLLKPGGWLLLDDLDWTYARSPSLRHTERVLAMPLGERTTPQVGKVFDLLVRQHPSFEEFSVEGSWGWAQKRM